MPNSLNGRHAPAVSVVKSVDSAELNLAAPASEANDDWSFATEELLDSMPRVWTRGLFYVLLLFVSVLLPWALFSRVDETGTAHGRLEPQGQTVQLDSEVTGAIAAIQVEEGDQVNAGQPLLTLDSELVKAELRQIQAQQQGQQASLTQLNQLRYQLTATLATQQQ